MDKFVIRGGNPLVGTVRISGAKNSALPCMAAALLTDETVTLENIPDVRDIETERKLLVAMGAEVELGYGRAHHRTTINCRSSIAPKRLTTSSRRCALPRSSSVLWLLAPAPPASPFPADAPSARAPSTSTSRDSKS